MSPLPNLKLKYLLTKFSCTGKNTTTAIITDDGDNNDDRENIVAWKCIHKVNKIKLYYHSL